MEGVYLLKDRVGSCPAVIRSCWAGYLINITNIFAATKTAATHTHTTISKNVSNFCTGHTKCRISKTKLIIGPKVYQKVFRSW